MFGYISSTFLVQTDLLSINSNLHIRKAYDPKQQNTDQFLRPAFHICFNIFMPKKRCPTQNLSLTHVYNNGNRLEIWNRYNKKLKDKENIAIWKTLTVIDENQ